MPKLNKIDLKAEVEGIEFAYDPQPGIKVWLGRMRNPVMVAWQNSPAGRERLRELKTQMSAEAALDRWFRESVAEFVVKRWDGIENEDGSPLPYSVEASIEFMVNPACYQWQDWVASKSDDINRFLVADAASAAKNSGTA